MLVVIEGLDGSGKSTQVKRLRAYLGEVAGTLDYIHFPRYDAPVYGELISRFLRGEFGSNDSVHPQLVALLFAEDRHGAAPEMKRILAGGGTVLLDRQSWIRPKSASVSGNGFSTLSMGNLGCLYLTLTYSSMSRQVSWSRS